MIAGSVMCLKGLGGFSPAFASGGALRKYFGSGGGDDGDSTEACL